MNHRKGMLLRICSENCHPQIQSSNLKVPEFKLVDYQKYKDFFNSDLILETPCREDISGLISSSVYPNINGFYCSEVAYNVIRKAISGIAFLRTNLSNSHGVISTIYWAQLSLDIYECIDYMNVDFIQRDLMQQNITPVDINSFEEFKVRSKIAFDSNYSTIGLRVSSFRVKDQFKSLEIIPLMPFHQGFWISNSFAEVLRENGIAGTIIKEVPAW